MYHRNVQRFRGGLVFKAHRLLYHSTLGLRVIKKKKKGCWCVTRLLYVILFGFGEECCSLGTLVDIQVWSFGTTQSATEQKKNA